MSEYNNNPAGAKQYVLDQIAQIENYEGPHFAIIDLIQDQVYGAIKAYSALGLFDYFEVDELAVKLSKAHWSATSNIINNNFN